MAIARFTRTPRSVFFPFAGAPTLPVFDEFEDRMRKVLDGELLAQPIALAPPTEIVENANELVLTAELPGMDQKDIDISVDDGILTLRGEKVEMKKEEDEEKKYYLFERTYGTFQRSFTLPHAVDANKISAEFDKGVLTVHMPKTAEAKVKGRKIAVNAAGK